MAIKVKRVTNANVYVNGTSLLGQVDEITLPNIKTIMAEHKALGMVGKLEFPSGVDKLEAKIKWNSFYETALGAAANPFQYVNLQVRADRMTWDSGGNSGEDAVVCYITASYKDFPMGSFKQHENVELESTLNVVYLKLEIAGAPIVEFDALSNIYKVNGIDILSQYRANIGQ